MDDEIKDYYVKLKLLALPRINYAVVSHLRQVAQERINNNYNELRYMESGWVMLRMASQTIELKAGEYAFFPADTPYELCAGGNVISVSVGFFLDEGVSEIVKKERIAFDKVNNTQFVENETLYFPFKGKLYADEKAYKLLKKLLSCYDGLEEYSNINVSSLMISFFVELANDALYVIKNLNEESGNIVEKYCQKVDQYIENNYRHVITMNIIARYIGLHENYINSIYHRNRGITIMKKLTLYRLEKAKELLAKKKYTTKEVAQMVGYKDSKYFNTVFKKYEDISPGKYAQRFYGDKVYSYETIDD